MSDLTIQLIVFRILALLLLAGVQGAIVAGVAVLLGDKGPRYDGRLTIVPTRHIDAIGAASLIVFGLGWSKSVDIDARNFRVGPSGIVGVILAGFVGLLAMAAILDTLIVPALTSMAHSTALTTAAFLRTASSLAIWFALLSLVPIPPLTGGLLWGVLGIPVSARLQLIFAALLFITVATGVAHRLLGAAYTLLATFIL